MKREIKTLKRKWARIYWVCTVGLLLSVALILLLRRSVLAWLAAGAFLAGETVSQEKLRCPYCGRSLSSIPRVSKSGGQCRYCYKDIVYDDEV